MKSTWFPEIYQVVHWESVFFLSYLFTAFAFQADLLFLSEVQVLHDITALVSDLGSLKLSPENEG